LAKLPAAVPVFRLILQAAVRVIPNPSSSLLQQVADQAHPKDVPILATALASEADFLATFNVRHFHPRITAPRILQPGKILAQIRHSLTHLLN
jgi:hypothetical protein